jgi:hypothetical protein
MELKKSMDDEFASKIYQDIILDWERDYKEREFSNFPEDSAKAGEICPEAKLYALPLKVGTISIYYVTSHQDSDRIINRIIESGSVASLKAPFFFISTQIVDKKATFGKLFARIRNAFAHGRFEMDDETIKMTDQMPSGKQTMLAKIPKETLFQIVKYLKAPSSLTEQK